MVAVEVGQEVMVLSGGARHAATQRGMVAKVGRVWIEIEVPGAYRTSTYRMRMDTQDGGGDFGYRERFYTMEQWETRQRRETAVTALSDQGINLTLASPWRGREHELAEIINRSAEEKVGVGAPTPRNDGKPSTGNPKDPKGPPPTRPVKQHPRQPPPPKK
jgi:hypothetical protein